MRHGCGVIPYDDLSAFKALRRRYDPPNDYPPPGYLKTSLLNNRFRLTAIAACLTTLTAFSFFPTSAFAEDAKDQHKVFSNSSEITGPIYGGQATAGGTAEGNSVTLSIKDGGTISSAVYGGHATGGNVLNNQLIISDEANFSSSGRSLYAGYLQPTSSASDLRVDDNKLTVGKGALVQLGSQSLIAANAQMPYSSSQEPASVSNNTVLIEDGATVEGNVKAAYGTSQLFSGNNVVVRGTVTQNVFGTDVTYPYGSQVSTEFDNISVTLENASVGGNVYAVNTASSTRTASVSNLRVSMTNSIVEGAVGAYNSSSMLVGELEFTGVNQVGRVYSYFETMTLNVGEDNKDKAVLTSTKELYGLNLSDKTLVINGMDSTIANGSYRLIDLAEGGTITFNAQTEIIKKGVFVDRLWELKDEDGEWANGLQIVNGDLMSGDELISLGEEKTNNNSKTLSEAFLGSIAFINQGAEFIADEGIHAMAAAAEPGKIATFGAIHGGSSRYKTGSHVDVDGVTLATGVASKFDNVMIAGFIEAGWASSESHVSGTKGDGDHDYYGLGVAVRWEPSETLYLDGSLRFGWTATEFSGRYADASAQYDTDSFYGSMHVGIGHLIKLSEKTNLDLYGRYVLTYLEGDDTGLGTPDGEKFLMDDTITHAFRVGTRLSGAFSENTTWRFGLAYEHVADGDAESEVVTSGVRASLDVPSLEGDSGIIEAGLSMRPSATSPWSAAIGIKGYIGDREGVAGNASVIYTF